MGWITYYSYWNIQHFAPYINEAMHIHEIIYVRRRAHRRDERVDGVKRGQTLSKSNSFRLCERLSAFERVHVLGVNAKHGTQAKRRISNGGDERPV